MSIKPEPFDTLFMELDSNPVDLSVHATLMPWPADVSGPSDDPDIFTYASREIFLQTVAGASRWQESDVAPASGAPGHLLGLGDGAVVVLTRRARSGRGFWLWSATAGTTVAISPAGASPTRDATLDVPVAAT